MGRTGTTAIPNDRVIGLSRDCQGLWSCGCSVVRDGARLDVLVGAFPSTVRLLETAYRLPDFRRSITMTGVVLSDLVPVVEPASAASPTRGHPPTIAGVYLRRPDECGQADSVREPIDVHPGNIRVLP